MTSLSAALEAKDKLVSDASLTSYGCKMAMLDQVGDSIHRDDTLLLALDWIAKALPFVKDHLGLLKAVIQSQDVSQLRESTSELDQRLAHQYDELTALIAQAEGTEKEGEE